jgi:general L-amino acid transport system substrate-binding protein
MIRFDIVALFAALLIGSAVAQPPAAAPPPGATPRQLPSDTLATVRARGELVCGVATAGVGLSMPDAQGVYQGIDAEYCRAFAAAVLGDKAKVRFVPTTTEQRFTALQSGEVDVLARATTWTFQRDANLGLAFVGVNLFDGQGFMVRAALGVKSAHELDGATICLLPGTTSEQNVTDWFRTNHMQFTPVVIENAPELQSAFFSGRCDVYSNDRSDMVGLRYAQGDHASDFVILPETISKEPLGPLVRQGDWRWFNVIKWVHFALLNAEELGVTQANVDEQKSNTNPPIRRLLGIEGDFGKQLGLPNDWAARTIRQVGNYGEIWQRTQGPLGVDRGLNRLWKDGGLQFAPPLR